MSPRPDAKGGEDLSVPPPSPCRAFVVTAPRVGRIDDRPGPALEGLPPDGVVVAPKVTGICGSDVHIYAFGGAAGTKTDLSKGLVMGHEPAGVVVAVGSAVTKVKPGDRIAIEPGKVDGVCAQCQQGDAELCHNATYAASGSTDGTIQTFWPMTEEKCHLLPDWVSLEEGALLQPLAITYSSILKTAALPPHSNIAIFGAGPVGLIHAALAAASAARTIIVVDPIDHRVEFARGFHAHHVWRPRIEDRRPGRELAWAQAEAAGIRGMLAEGTEIDVVFECSGADAAIQTSIELLKPKGTHVQVGFGDEPTQAIPLFTCNHKALKMLFALRYGPGAYPAALDLVARRAVDLKPLISHRFPFERAGEAYEAALRRVREDGRPVMKCLIMGPTGVAE